VITAVSSINDLEIRIRELEKVQAEQIAELKLSAIGIAESFSPSHILKSALTDVVQSPGLRNTVINTAIGIGVGLLGKKIYVGNSGNLVKKVTGSALQFIIANWVRKKIPGEHQNNRVHQKEA
jgi:hypothetical protein